MTAILVVLVGTVGGVGEVSAQNVEARTHLFVRGDTDSTLVVSPGAGVELSLNSGETVFDVGYAADVWTSASIDIRSAATDRVTEHRDQIDLSVTRAIGIGSIGSSYYFSFEPDYVAHNATFFASQELNQKNTTLSESFSLAYDRVGRSGDPTFDRPARQLSSRLSLTQVINPKTLVQFNYQLTLRQGFMSSPYRYVALGGNEGRCGSSNVGLCVPEVVPDRRVRHALVARGRHALSSSSSIGLAYRTYFDSWGLVSHTAAVQLAWVLSEVSTLTLRYRFYIQGKAYFYERAYEGPEALTYNYVTRDRELSALHNNRVAMSYGTHFDVGGGREMHFELALGATLFKYDDFVGLDQVLGVDSGFSLTMEL